MELKDATLPEEKVIVQKGKRLSLQACQELPKEKSIPELGCTDLTPSANMNRSVFYKNITFLSSQTAMDPINCIYSSLNF